MTKMRLAKGIDKAENLQHPGEVVAEARRQCGEPDWDVDVTLACAIAESLEAQKRCYVCGHRTLFPKFLPPRMNCPLASCGTHSCYNSLHCKWLDIKADLDDCDRSICTL